MTTIFRQAAVSAMMALGIAVVSAASSSSLLSSGKWVKIGVTDSGLYEITAEELRALGFSDPEKVGVFGWGGVQATTVFKNSAGESPAKDDLVPVATLVHNNKLYFYGRGVEEINFVNNPNTAAGGYFDRSSKNIYSDTGVYFLTDCVAELPHLAPSKEPDFSGLSSTILGDGAGYVYHELDLEHNNYNNGQLFWGETFRLGTASSQSWPVTLPGLRPSWEATNATLRVEFYAENVGSVAPRYHYGVNNRNYLSPVSMKDNSDKVYTPQELKYRNLPLDNENSEVFLEVTNITSGDFTGALDYWVLTYAKQIPNLSLSGLSQDYIHYRLFEDSYGTLLLPDYHIGMAVLDVTDPQKPKMIWLDGEGGANILGHSKGLNLLVADLDKPQKKIITSGYGLGPVTNQDIHNQMAYSPELVIITLPWLREGAEELAEWHRRHDGIRVVVATSEELYNEYSGGVPDPMAYRACARHGRIDAYGGKTRNMLLYGPIVADFRGITSPRDPSSALIAYQFPVHNSDEHLPNVNDWYGMLSDNIVQTDLMKETVHVGVGVLPVADMTEARRVNDKVRRFHDDPEMAWRVAETMIVGGVGDNHLHDGQAVTLATAAENVGQGRLVHSTLAVDAYGAAGANTRFIDYINQGKMWSIYFGHGNSANVGGDAIFFSASDISRLSKAPLGFMMFCGCDLSNTDRGGRGLGESIVTSTEGGMLGTLIATRQSWSGRNQNFATKMFSYLFREDGTSSPRKNSITIGEAVAKSKTELEDDNSLAYQLMCDPAVKLPLPTANLVLDEASASASLTPGTQLTLSGRVCSFTGEFLSNYNGKVTVKVNEPTVTRRSQDLVTGNIASQDKTIDVTYYDERVATASGEIKDGLFTVTVTLPSSLGTFVGQPANIFLGGYDQSLHKGSASHYTMEVTLGSGEEDEDTEAPKVGALSYDFPRGSLAFTVTDDYGVAPAARGAMTVAVDGRSFTGQHCDVETVEKGKSYRCVLHVGLTGYSAPVTVTVTDRAGNTANVSQTVAVNEPKAKLTLKLDGTLVTEKASFELLGAGRDLNLRITDSHGALVYTAPVSGNAAEWSLTDLNGDAVPSGLYKACVVTESGDAGMYSNWVDVPVLVIE